MKLKLKDVFKIINAICATETFDREKLDILNYKKIVFNNLVNQEMTLDIFFAILLGDQTEFQSLRNKVFYMISKCDMETDNIETDRIIIVSNNDCFQQDKSESQNYKRNSFSLNKMDSVLSDEFQQNNNYSNFHMDYKSTKDHDNSNENSQIQINYNFELDENDINNNQKYKDQVCRQLDYEQQEDFNETEQKIKNSNLQKIISSKMLDEIKELPESNSSELLQIQTDEQSNQFSYTSSKQPSLNIKDQKNKNSMLKVETQDLSLEKIEQKKQLVHNKSDQKLKIRKVPRFHSSNQKKQKLENVDAYKQLKTPEFMRKKVYLQNLKRRSSSKLNLDKSKKVSILSQLQYKYVGQIPQHKKLYKQQLSLNLGKKKVNKSQKKIFQKKQQTKTKKKKMKLKVLFYFLQGIYLKEHEIKQEFFQKIFSDNIRKFLRDNLIKISSQERIDPNNSDSFIIQIVKKKQLIQEIQNFLQINQSRIEEVQLQLNKFFKQQLNFSITGQIIFLIVLFYVQSLAVILKFVNIVLILF